ncbi:CD276 antigen-like isoform X1 [Conger conger]|uniref:CD276 antigen-like isoform X1 n=1 Tax=Conger conger TaxID=82655 RepID=UPI002A5ADD56|nr:CD276 antigen-like isoform X1 [Conger conger]
MHNRGVLGIMGLVWILLASSLLPVNMQATVRAVVGGDVLLPCSCPHPPPDEHYLVWQIGQHTNVNYAIAKTRTENISPQFLNRTRLFYPADPGNCSLHLQRVRVSDGKTYSCHYNNPKITNVTVSLEVTAPYSLQCSTNSTGELYQCTASGGFPEGRVYWLQAGQAVEKYTQDHLTGLYNITSILRTTNHSSTVQCVLENPPLQHNITITCSPEGVKAPRVSEELKASLAVGSVLLILAAVFLIVLFTAWKPCPSSKVSGPYERASSAEGGTCGSRLNESQSG